MLYANLTITNISRFFYESKTITINGEEFISLSSRSQRSPAIATHWPGVIGIDGNGEAVLRVRMGVSFFYHHIKYMKDTGLSDNVPHIIVKWYMNHPCRDFIHPQIIICATIFDSDSPAS